MLLYRCFRRSNPANHGGVVYIGHPFNAPKFHAIEVHL